MKGTLAEGVLPGLLRSLYVGRKSGRLHFIQSQSRRTVRLQRGQIVGAESNVIEERLGETLVRLGQLADGDLTRATEIVIRDGKRLGRVLRELEIFDNDRLQDALGLQTHEILKKVFSTTDGEYEFDEILGDQPFDEDMTLKVSTGELILEAVDRIQDPEVVRRSLGDLARRLVLPSDPLLRFQKVTLTPADGYILSRVDGTTSAREIIQMLSLPEDEVCRSLLGLLSTGLVEFGPAPTAKRREREPVPPPPTAAPKASAPPAAPPIRPPVAPPPVIPTSNAVPPPGSTPPAAPAASKADTIEDRRREILDAWNGLKTRTHYEVMGLGTDATAAQVKEAYFRLAKRFHPDAHTDPALADLHAKLEAVFIRLGQAYEALKSRVRDPEPAPAPPAPAPAPVRPPTPPEPAPPAGPRTLDPRAVLETLRKAQAKFDEEKYWDAIQLLEEVVQGTEGKLAGKVRVLLAQCYMKNPNWVRRAEEQVQMVLAKEPNQVDANYVLASIYKAGGLKSRALTYLRKVVELKPDHEPALADLAALSPPESMPPPSEGGGILKKLFGKS
jgi:hypothetical protein